MSKCKVCKKDEVYYQNTIIQMFKDLSGKYSMVELFNDYLERECASHQAMLGRDIEHYIEIRKYLLGKYETSIFKAFDKITSVLVEGLTNTHRDILGVVFMQMNPNKKLGQFFTPSHICELMVKVTDDSVEEINRRIKQNGYATVSDPCCGAGAMQIAYYKYVLEQGIDIDKIVFHGKDIDIRCAQMTFLQLEHLNTTALIEVGDTILDTVSKKYITAEAYIKEKGRVSLALSCMRYLQMEDMLSETT